MAQWLSERIGQQFVVENRPGANTNIAIQAAINSPPDGYTLVGLTSSNASNATLYDSLPFNLQRDIVPVAGLSRGALVLPVNPSGPAKLGRGPDAARQGQPGQVQRRILRRWLDQPLGEGAVQADDEDQRDPCPLSRRRTRADRRHQRKSTRDVQHGNRLARI